jgi:hypothetical protein
MARPRTGMKVRMAMRHIGDRSQQSIGFFAWRHVFIEPDEAIESRRQRKLFNRPILGDCHVLPDKMFYL